MNAIFMNINEYSFKTTEDMAFYHQGHAISFISVFDFVVLS